MGIVDKAIEVTALIIEPLTKIAILEEISQYLVQIGNLPAENHNPNDLSEFALLLINSGHDSLAFEIVNLATDYYQKACTYKKISSSLINEEDIDKSIEIANMIDEEFTYMKIEALSNIWTFLKIAEMM